MANFHLQADSASVIPTLGDVRVNGITPFMGPSEDLPARFEEAHALLTFMASAYRVCDEAGLEKADALHNLNSDVKAKALEGIATLLALGLHHQEAGEAERRAAR